MLKDQRASFKEEIIGINASIEEIDIALRHAEQIYSEGFPEKKEEKKSLKVWEGIYEVLKVSPGLEAKDIFTNVLDLGIETKAATIRVYLSRMKSEGKVINEDGKYYLSTE